MTPEEKIADLKANFDYVLEGKDVEIKELKETLAQTIENDEVAYETLKLHDQEEIGMLQSRVAELEQELQDLKDRHAEEVELHLHAEDYIKSLEQQIEKMKRCQNCKYGYCGGSSISIDTDGNRTFHNWNEEKEDYCDVGNGKRAKYQLWELKENE
jgi:DNA-binding transcriptional MerR regulator